MVERSQTGGWMPGLYEPIRKAGQKIAEWFAPRADAALTTAAYEIALELPGVAQENIEITVQDGMLLVSGEKPSQHEEAGKNYLCSEREYGAFKRAFRIPPDADPEAIDADLKHGVLTIRLPKARVAETTAKKIPIRAS